MRTVATEDRRRSGAHPTHRAGLRKTEFVCLGCGYTEVRYFPTRRRPSANPLYCQHCPGVPAGTGEMLVAYWLEGPWAHPANPLRSRPPGIVRQPHSPRGGVPPCAESSFRV